MKKPFQKFKSPFSEKDKVRVKNSYYTFSESYPRDRFKLNSKHKRKSAGKRVKNLSYVLLFVFLFLLSFFAVRGALDISFLPIKEEAPLESSFNAGEIFSEQGIRALYYPEEKITDKAYLKSFIKKARIYDCNSVVITFKTFEGRLSFTSKEPIAISSKVNSFDNFAIRDLISAFEKKELIVIARIFCFEDEAAAKYNPDIAVKYMNTSANFKDLSFKSGSYWLNPFSKKAKNYLLSLIRELSELKISSFILESVQFPFSKEVGATYPGEKRSSNRNEVLLSFLSEAKKAVPEKGFLILAEDGSDAQKGNKAFYFGSLSSGSFDSILADTRKRDSSVVISKDSSYGEILSFYSDIQKRFKNKLFVPMLSFEEYSRSLFRAMKKNGYSSYVLIDESGTY